MRSYHTVFGSLGHYEKGRGQVIQATDAIIWDVNDGKTGRPRAKVTMRADDVAAMPKRSMRIVWENNDDRLPAMYGKGELKPYPVEF